jgi:Fe-S-cluster containining protein
MPGYLLPGDAERIAQYLGMSLEDLQDYLLASPGAIVMGPSAFGRVRKRIRTIVPAQNEDGSCVFLNGEDRCSIHSAAPYGCGWFDTHQSQEQGEERSYEGLITITEQANNSPYKTLWRRLEEKGRVAKSVQSRRETADTVVREATRSAEKGVDE